MLPTTLRAHYHLHSLSHGYGRPPHLLARRLLSSSRQTSQLPHTARFTTQTPLFAHAQAATMANDEQQQWAAAKVRQTFLDYFKERGHSFGIA